VTRPNNTLRLTSYDNAGELTNIVEEATTKFPICFYTLHYNLAARTDWEFKGPLPHAYTPPTRTMTYDADNRLATFNMLKHFTEKNLRRLNPERLHVSHMPCHNGEEFQDRHLCGKE